MQKPPREKYESLSVYAVPPPDRVWQVETVLRQLEMGDFMQPALIADAMYRDDRLAGCLTTRINGLLGRPLEFFEYRDQKRARTIAKKVEDHWPDVVEESTLSDVLKNGLLLGAGLAEITWDTDGPEWWPRLKAWHPQFLRWDAAEWKYILTTKNGEQVVINPGDGKWLLYTPYGHDYGWMRALMRSLARPWLIRQWAYRDWARFSEVHGMPMRKAIVPGDASDDDKKRFVAEMNAAVMNNEAVVKIPQSGNESKYDLQLLEAMSTSHLSFKELIDLAEASIAICILGQNLSTQVSGGSYAAAKVHDIIRTDFKRSDAITLARCLREQVLRPWARFNYGDAEKAPWIEWQTEPPADASDTAKAQDLVADALTKFKLAGAPIDMRQLLMDAGIPILDEAEVDGVDVHPQAIGGANDPTAAEPTNARPMIADSASVAAG